MHSGFRRTFEMQDFAANQVFNMKIEPLLKQKGFEKNTY